MNYERYSEIIIPPEADLKLPTNNNSRYFYNNKVKELVLDILFDTANDGTFDLKLADPLIIDVEHDIFLDIVITDNFLTGVATTNPQGMAFLLSIDQFNIQTKSATNIIKSGAVAGDPDQINNKINNSIVIPNESTTTTGTGPTIHKGRKHNYIGTITPSKLMQITGSVSNMGDATATDATPTYGVPFTITDDSARMIVEFKLVPRQ